MEIDEDTQLRVEALQTAAKLCMSSNLSTFDVVKRAEEFHAFLTGKNGLPDPTAVTYRLVPDGDSDEGF